MLGPALSRKRVRSISRAAVIVYVAVLALLTFGHTCGCEEAAAGETLGVILPVHLCSTSPAVPHPDHACLACAWQAATIGIALAPERPVWLHVKPLCSTAPDVQVCPARLYLQPAPRGPPSV